MARGNRRFNNSLQVEGFDASTGLEPSDFWEWYCNHRDDVVLNVGFWVVNFDVRVKDLKPFFEMIFRTSPSC